MKMKEKQKKRKAYEPKLTQEELMDSSTFKRFLASIDNILENLEDVDFTTMGNYQHRFTLCLQKHLSSVLNLIEPPFLFAFSKQQMMTRYLRNCCLVNTS